MIGFDPRGVDRSNGLRCLTDAEQDAVTYLDDSPDDPAEQAAIDAAKRSSTQRASRSTATRCGTTPPPPRPATSMRSGLRWATTRSACSASRTARTCSRPTRRCFPIRFARWCSTRPTSRRATRSSRSTRRSSSASRRRSTTGRLVRGDCRLLRSRHRVGAAWDELSAQLDAYPYRPTTVGWPTRQCSMRGDDLGALQRERVAGVGRWADRRARRRPRRLLAMADDYVGREPDGTFSTIQQAGRHHPLRERHRPGAARRSGRAGRDAPRTGAAFQPRHDPGGLGAEDGDVDGCGELMPAAELVQIDYSGDAADRDHRWQQRPGHAVPVGRGDDRRDGRERRLVTFTGEGHG